MVELTAYAPEYRDSALTYVEDYFSLHKGLVMGGAAQGADDRTQTEQSLDAWRAEPDVLYVILFYGKAVGFLHLRERGPDAAWIEDIYVDKMFRGKGIATQSIVLAENLAKETRRYSAICIDVPPRNIDALRLYHRLGYVELSLITVRKELQGEPKESWDRGTDILGFEFRY